MIELIIWKTRIPYKTNINIWTNLVDHDDVTKLFCKSADDDDDDDAADDDDDNDDGGDDVDEVSDEDNDEDIVDENEEDEEVFDDWEAGIWMTWYVGLINAGWVLMTVWCGEINELVIFETCGGAKLIG